MHRQRQLRRALNATDPTAKIIIPAESMFVFNGTSSDLAQQFYQRYQAGDAVDKLGISHKKLPQPVKDRLASYNLKFKDLHSLLQRALLWDSGYVLDASDNSKLIKIYTANDTSMADIAVSYAEFAAGCSVTNCSSSSSLYQSTAVCTGSTLAPMLKCASEQVTVQSPDAGTAAAAASTVLDTSFWATGGNSKAIPELTIAQHAWIDVETKQAYSVHAIHSIPISQESTAECSGYSSMIIPCAQYDSSLSSTTATQWTAPKAGKLVTVWLEHAQADKPGFNMYYTVLILVGVLVGLVLLIVLGCKGTSRFRKRQQRRAEAKMTSADPQAFLDASHSNDLAEMSAVVALTPVHAILESDLEKSNDWNNAFLSSEAFAGKRLRMDHLVFKRQIAQGTHSEVWVAKYHGERVAVKKMVHVFDGDDKNSDNSTSARKSEWIPAFSRETEILASLRHRNIARFYGVAWDSPECLCVISEYARKGSLQHVLDKQTTQEEPDSSKQLTWEEKQRIVIGVAKALKYLHTRRDGPMVHGSLCCKNVLLSSHCEPKLIGVGATWCANEVASSSLLVWEAPEVLQGAPVTPQSDVYALGVLIAELIGHFPLSQRAMRLEGEEEHKQESEAPTAVDNVPRSIQEVMTQCLATDPSLRPSLRAIVQTLEPESTR